MAGQSQSHKKASLAHIKVIRPIYKRLNQAKAKIQTRVRFNPHVMVRLSAVGHLWMVLQKLRDVLINGILLLRCVPPCCVDPRQLQIAHTFHNKCKKTH